jgi:hypothetical protein
MAPHGRLEQTNKYQNTTNQPTNKQTNKQLNTDTTHTTNQQGKERELRQKKSALYQLAVHEAQARYMSL